MSVEASTRAFAATSEVLPEVRRFLAAEMDRLSFRGFVHDMQLAVTEACTNSIRHAGASRILVTIVPSGACLEITVEDDGVYRRSIPIPEMDGTGHRGLHLMAAVVDDLSVRPGTPGRAGTVVRFVKCRR